MSLATTFLFDCPQTEIASGIQSRLAACETVKLVTGFATPGGIDAIAAPIRARPGILSTLIVGAGTYPAFEALDELLATGVSPGSLFIHLGHTAATTGKKHPFARYRPMLHSKIFYFEMRDGSANAFIGSNNLTAYAMHGLNGEACVLLEGEKENPVFEEIRKHIDEAKTQAAHYKSFMKSAYTYWFREYFAGLGAEALEPSDFVNVRTILILAQSPIGSDPYAGDKLFFELPQGITRLERLSTQVHLFLFETLPTTSSEALCHAATCKRRFSCVVTGLTDKQGFTEVPANWKLSDCRRPRLEKIASGTLRPATGPSMAQVQAEVKGALDLVPDYRFHQGANKWEPVYQYNEKTSLLHDYGVSLNEPKGADLSDNGWHLVKDLKLRESGGNSKEQASLALVAPDSGSFILVSTGLEKRQS